MSHIRCFTLRSVLLQEQGFGSCGVLPKPLNQSQGAVRGDTSTAGARQRPLNREALLFSHGLLAEHFKCVRQSVLFGLKTILQ